MKIIAENKMGGMSFELTKEESEAVIAWLVKYKESIAEKAKKRTVTDIKVNPLSNFRDRTVEFMQRLDSKYFNTEVDYTSLEFKEYLWEHRMYQFSAILFRMEKRGLCDLSLDAQNHVLKFTLYRERIFPGLFTQKQTLL